MRKTLAFWLVMVASAAALIASALLLIDYVRPAPVFCAPDGGCAAVKATIFAHPLGLPMPLYGLGGFLAVALAQLLPGRPARIAQALLAVFGAIVGGGLLAVQAMMHVVCPFCAIADTAALLLAGLSLARVLRGWDPPIGRRHLAGAATFVVAAAVLPLGVGMLKRPLPQVVPSLILTEMQQTGHGRVTVVDFVDFECPFCRMTHEDFAPLLAARKDKVRVVRKHVPLRMHVHAADAARAACCGEKLGKGEEVAEALFVADPSSLTPEGCRELAVKLGLDSSRFEDCLADPAIAERIRKDGEEFRASGGHGLPTIYIDRVKLEGAQERAVLESTLDSAIRAL